MNRRTIICLCIIIAGLVNYLVYAIGWYWLGGEAMNGKIEAEVVAGRTVLHHYLIAHGDRIEVSRAKWIYSAVHSISIWITFGAVNLAMLTLAKDRIISSMRRSIVRGRTMITILAVVVTMISVGVSVWFLRYMIVHLLWPGPVKPA